MAMVRCGRPGSVRERLLDRRAGLGQVRAGQVAEPREVAEAGGVIARVRGHGRHRVRSGRRLAHEEWTAYPKDDVPPGLRPAGDRTMVRVLRVCSRVAWRIAGFPGNS